MRSQLIGAAACLLLLPGAVQAQIKAEVVSKGPRFELKKIIKDEGTTVVLFLQYTSVMESQFLTDLQKQLPPNEKVGLRVVKLKDLSAPAAQQYVIKATPT